MSQPQAFRSEIVQYARFARSEAKKLRKNFRSRWTLSDLRLIFFPMRFSYVSFKRAFVKIGTVTR